MIFLSLLSFAQDDLEVETYCFPSVAARVRAEKKLGNILVPSDKLTSEKECFTVQMRLHRRELIQNFTHNLDEGMSIRFSSADFKREPCKLKVEKVRSFLKNNTNVQVSQFPNANTTTTEEKSTDVMQIQTLDNFALTVSQDAIEGKCRYINENKYEIQISARRDPKPLVPPNLPPGTMVVVTTPPPEQKTISVSTTLQLTRGERVEIGSIVKDLRKKDQTIDIKPEASTNNTDGQDEEKVFLSFQ